MSEEKGYKGYVAIADKHGNWVSVYKQDDLNQELFYMPAPEPYIWDKAIKRAIDMYIWSKDNPKRGGDDWHE